jgi:hypothetical protein
MAALASFTKKRDVRCCWLCSLAVVVHLPCCTQSMVDHHPHHAVYIPASSCWPHHAPGKVHSVVKMIVCHTLCSAVNAHQQGSITSWRMWRRMAFTCTVQFHRRQALHLLAVAG